MKTKERISVYYLLFLLLMLASINPNNVNAQSVVTEFDLATKKILAQDEKTAISLVEKYKELIQFNNGITPASIEQFQELFSDTALIVFDLPLIDTASRNMAIKPISKDESQQDKMISVYLKKMPVKTYAEMLQLLFIDKNLLNQITIKNDPPINVELYGNILFYFKMTKIFPDNKKFARVGAVDYILTVIVKGNKALITDISRREFPNEFDLQLKLLNENTGDPIAEITSFIGIENVNRYGVVIDTSLLTAVSDSNGFIRVPQSTNEKSEIYFWTIKSSTEIKYRIWDGPLGIKRGTDPAKVFEVKLIPYKMKAVSATLFVSGGMVSQTPVSITNFSNGSFNEEFSYKVGGGILVNWFWNAKKWTDYSRTNPALFGLTIGISYSVNQISTNSSDFIQNKYEHEDVTGQETRVEYSSGNMTERDKIPQIGFPLLLDLNLKLGDKGTSLLFGIGAKFNYNLKSNYQTSGTFSRHGYYAINDYTRPITDAPEFNYYTNQNLTFEGDLTLNLWMTEAMFRMTSLVPLIDGIGRKYNLEIGLEFTYPITKNNRYYKSNLGISTENAAETDYWINTGEDVYHSVIYGNDRIYNYYLGVSIGFNIVGFVAKKKEKEKEKVKEKVKEKKLSQQGRY